MNRSCRPSRKQAKPHRKLSIRESCCGVSTPFIHQLYNHAADPERSGLHLSFSPIPHEKLSSDCVAIDMCRNTSISTVPAGIKDLTFSAANTDYNECNSSEQDTLQSRNFRAYDHSASCQTHLKFLRDKIFHHGYSKVSYLQIVDSLAAVGGSFPPEEMVKILADILKSDSIYFINRMNVFLCQHYLKTVDVKALWEIMKQSLQVLRDVLAQEHVELSQAAGFQAGKTILEYIFNVLVNDLIEDSCGGHPCLLEEILLMTSEQSWHNQFFDITFSLLELELSGSNSLCLDTMLSLALLPLLTCNSEVKQEELSTVLATDLSPYINKVSTTFKKHLVLSRIPSDNIRLKVIDIYLDTCFITASGEHIPEENREPFSLSKFKNMHLYKIPVKAEGIRQDLGFFLGLLTMLLQSYLFIVTGVPLLSFLPDKSFGSSGTRFREDLSELNHPVMMFINRLSSDPQTSADLITPTNWYYLELLITLTS